MRYPCRTNDFDLGSASLRTKPAVDLLLVYRSDCRANGRSQLLRFVREQREVSRSRTASVCPRGRGFISGKPGTTCSGSGGCSMVGSHGGNDVSVACNTIGRFLDVADGRCRLSDTYGW